MARTNSPRLVRPDLVHDTHFAGQIGIQTPATIGQRQGELAAEKQQLVKAPAVGGTLADDTAVPNLLTTLHKSGIITDQTELGVPNVGIEPAARWLKVLGQTTPDVGSTTNLVTFSRVIHWSIFGAPEVTASWTMYVIAGCNFDHSASGNIDRKISITDPSGTYDGVVSGFGATTIPAHYVSVLEIANIGPAFTVEYLYHPTSAGTASVRAPWMIVYGVRSGLDDQYFGL